ncbi:unnamed protein product [Trifolium pratense]|uniref:Uncharacterized protein n=1 Tax=Trifolium pratense TaxID=57577 RepID=A0ACB0KW31_TRIPR|nr:unnamed protein product [Trifolium pratense]
MANSTTLVGLFKIILVMLMMSTLFMSLLQARKSLGKHIDSKQLLHELLCFGQIKHRRTQRSLGEDRISPSGPNGKHNKFHS